MTLHLVRAALPPAAFCGLALLCPPPAAAQEPERVAVEKGAFEVRHEFAGSLDQPDAARVSCRPKAYKGALEVLEAAAPGEVLAGQVLVKLDLEELEKQLEKARLDLEIARAGVEKKSHDTRHAEEAAALAMETSEAAFEKARQTLESYRDVLMPMRRAEAELSLQSSRDRMQDEEDQFEQLRKMYASDDLVEETEEIVLARARRSLEQQRKRMVFTERRHELQMKYDLPRELEGHEFALRKATNDLERLRATSELSLEEGRMALQKAKRSLQQQETALEELEADREALRVVAPCEGLAVRGKLDKGKWTELATEPSGLEAGKKLAANQVLYTIVQPGPRTVRATAPEATVMDLKLGQVATVIPAVLPDLRLAATVRGIAPVSSNGSYDLWLELDEAEARLLPGHACQIQLSIQKLDEALTVPETAVERSTEGTRVFVWQDGQPQARAVELGRTHQGRVHVRSGLTAGEEVLKQASAGSQ